MTNSRLVLGITFLLLAADTVSAGLFGFGQRRWARRKAELRSELVYQLNNKLDQDLAREVEAAKAELSAAAQQQIQTECTKLQAEVAQAVVELRKQAAKLIAVEAKRLETQIGDQVRQLRVQSEKIVRGEAEKIQQKANQLRKKTLAMQATLDQQISQMPALIAAQVNTEVAKQLKEAAKQLKEAAKKSPKPVVPTNKKNASATPEKATVPKEPKVVTEKTAKEQKQ